MHENAAIRYMLMIGNPVDGLSFVGPFAREEHAEAWGEIHAADDEWQIVLLHCPAHLIRQGEMGLCQ